MPRRKQVHPKPLRDKIEEAQKELQAPECTEHESQLPEDPSKEFHDSKGKRKANTVKGIKRKKIVAENILKKIPRSPVKTLAKSRNDRENLEAAVLFSDSSVASELLKKDHLFVQNGGVETERESQQEHSQGLNQNFEKTKPGRSMQKGRIEATQHSIDSCSRPPNWRAQQLERDVKVKSPGIDKIHALSKERPQHQLDHLSLFREHWIIKPENNTCSTHGISPSYASTAFDVLLKAMEPELKTLSSRKSSLIAEGSRKSNATIGTQGESTGISTITSQVLKQTSVIKSEFGTGSQDYCNVTQIVPKSGNREQAQVQPSSYVHYQQTRFVSPAAQQNQHHALSQRFNGSPSHQHSQEKHYYQSTYNLTVTPLGHPQASVMPHGLPQSQLLGYPKQSIAANPPNCVQVAPGYNQMSDILLKDQKPKKQGKYICEYCNRACAKPSVLQKHIRSHTGERPYPCITCGFSFKTKSNLYKHKKSHAHAIKLGLVLRSESSGASLSQESDRALNTHSDVEESGESDDESTSEERLFEQKHFESEPAQVSSNMLYSEKYVDPVNFMSSDKLANQTFDCEIGESVPPQKSCESKVTTALPKVVVYPVTVSPRRADSPKVTTVSPERATAQQETDPQTARIRSISTLTSPIQKLDHEDKEQIRMSHQEEHEPQLIMGHAQLQRQQATDFSQQQQVKHHLSPRSLGSTDSGYFSRSESADQQMSPISPFQKLIATTDMDPGKNILPCPPHSSHVISTVLYLSSPEKASVLSAPVRISAATKTLEERISKLISDNEAVVDDKQLDSVKPRRTSLSRRGSIDSPKPYTFKDSFQFDLRPLHSGRRTSSSSDIPKSPFTPTDKSKQVFLLSVPPQFPSLDCLPITRSNSMPATPGYSTIRTSTMPAAHPLRESHSFDDKIGGSFSDDVFVLGPSKSLQAAHPRTLVRQTAVEDSSISDGQSFASVCSMDENYHRRNLADILMPRSKSFEHTFPTQEKMKKSQGRGSMYECETCRNRYRKLENFENHKKFYCSELHGPKSKPTVSKDSEQETASRSTQPQILHYRVMGPKGVLEQPLQVRKRRKIRSIGDDDEVVSSECTRDKAVNKKPSTHPVAAKAVISKGSNAIASIPQTNSINAKNVPFHISNAEHSLEAALSFSSEIPIQSVHSPLKERGESSRTSSGVSVIQHTNSLSRTSSFENAESIDRISPVPLQEKDLNDKIKQPAIFVGEGKEEIHLPQLASAQQLETSATRVEMHETLRMAPADINNPLQQSRLVRQRNIQVPEILVTEEPDRLQEPQGNDQEKGTETFHWPQRSETLSKLPTEKLPPKKKRIRLAEMEHSSGESSFDSTLSRSLSRDSSLSRCSSLSASFDRDDAPRIESPSKAEAINKSSEFLTLPGGTNTLVVPSSHYREMRRAASEQSSSLQHSMEAIAGIRSKSFDCGSISPTRSVSPVVPMEMVSPLISSPIETCESVPLIERRRGPLVRQMSLSIGPETSQPQVVSSNLFQQNLSVQISAVPHLKGPLAHRPVSFLTSQHPLSCALQVQHTTQHESMSSAQDVSVNNLIHIQPPEGLPGSVQRPIQSQLPHENTNILLANVMPGHLAQNTLGQRISQSSEPQDNRFAPKYQLHPCQPCLLPSAAPQLPIISLPIPVTIEASGLTSSVSTKSLEIVSNLYLVPQVQQVITAQSPSNIQPLASLVVPVGSNKSVYNIGTFTTLPQILLTPDQSSQLSPVICDLDNSTRDKEMLTTAKDYPELHESEVTSKIKMSAVPENCNSQSESRNSPVHIVSQNYTKKILSDELLAHQETTVSSKRMLSPANSLDIAMENQQKRAKDENGSVSNSNLTSIQLHCMVSFDSNKHKKPTLVRQVCTTDQVDVPLPVDQEGTPQYYPETSEFNSSPTKSNQEVSAVASCQERTVISRETLKSEHSSHSPSPSCTVIKKSPAPISSISPQLNNTLLKSSTNIQGNKLPFNKNNQIQPMSNLERTKVGASFPITSTRNVQRASLSTLKTSTSFSWCYLTKCKPLHIQQADKKTSAYASWPISSNNLNPLGLPTKVVLGLLSSKQKNKKLTYTQAKTTLSRSGILVPSSKWKADKSKALVGRTLSPHESNSKDSHEPQQGGDLDKLHSAMKSEPRRIRIFDGGYKSNEEYVYVRGRGRGKYICEECGIRCKKPSMLRKHIRTHTDLRPYHCNYCNFSFKTKGNLTKHMKSKAHSKKCMEMGLSVASFEDQDTDESGDRSKAGYDRPYSDGEDSDGQDEDDNDVEDDDEDSQGETGLSASPSVTASPQHHIQRHDHQLDTLNAASASLIEDVVRIAKAPIALHTASLEVLPDAWFTQIATDPGTSKLKSKTDSIHQRLTEEENSNPKTSPAARDTMSEDDHSSPSHLLSPNRQQENIGPKVPCSIRLSPHPQLGSAWTNDPLTASLSPASSSRKSVGLQYEVSDEEPPMNIFSHLPLHSRQQSRMPYSMVPVGGIQLVPAGLAAYSTFVPIQAGPVQLTIPAVSVIHRTTSPSCDEALQTEATAKSLGVSEMNTVLPCIPFGQVSVCGLHSMNTSSLQTVEPLGLETLNILSSSNLGPQINPSGLALNSVGLQMLTTNPQNRSTPSPGAQILNMAPPAFMPSMLGEMGQSTETHFTNKLCQTRSEQIPISLPVTVHVSQITCTLSPQVSPRIQACCPKDVSDTSVASEHGQPHKTGERQRSQADGISKTSHRQPHNNKSATTDSDTGQGLKGYSAEVTKSPVRQAASPERIVSKPVGTTQRRVTVQYSDVSSDDEDRLVIAT
ncbi:zinc finger protein 40 isoform X1 [Callorhinchus milii]|uniref:zinc finger protein 40 isoform X1 n=1 Tax=Callorhinchus milii TaxID=7868 RepID=UPI001C3FA97D|nr:zinc finger protein 40 isoform X1 [Callorhinchus milii]XP_042188330.1 zinc finger protein 40 isoform X1 [Callorhinchus milii]